MESAGATIRVLSPGPSIGRSPGFSSLAKNWLKVSHPLGEFGLLAPVVGSVSIEFWMLYCGEFSMNEFRISSLKDSVVSRNDPHRLAYVTNHLLNHGSF